MTAPVLVPAAGLTPFILAALRERQLPKTRPSALFLALGLTGVYLLANASWSLAPRSSYATVGTYAMLVATAYVAINGLTDLRPAVRQVLALGIAAGVAVGAAILLFEVSTGLLLRRALASVFPALRPGPLQFQVDGGVVTSILPEVLNRTTSALTLCVWPVLLLVGRLDAARWVKALLYIALAGGVAGIYVSEHQTSMLAVLGSALAFAICLLSRPIGLSLTALGWTTATLLVVPLCMLAYAGGAYHVQWLPNTARERIVIWGYTTEQIPKAPMLGVGLGTSRVLNEQTRSVRDYAPGTDYRRTTRGHSHNIYLQAWFETGAVGAGLLFVLGLLVLNAIKGAAAAAQPYLAATFVASALVAASSFSLWAPWFMACFALVAILGWLAALLTEDEGSSAPQSHR
jgi:O-antigen ligase